uniref:Putative nucleic acid ATP-dependent helicase Type III restriction enzyme, res subunit n=1 Tax=Magnetococcus massalia (strain MO-1) TaxID=451514 RepID=A0A1S7LGJ5_MAGMO|nr:Putative nucleic acid ATP-dependent helicase Type III restriction enzyme, res subunit [Candidatus Magnetococcus massalia]
MILRPRQKTFVERSVAALQEHGNTIAVASTGFGKTVALSAVVGQILKKKEEKACILAHRDELTRQNVMKFTKVNPGLSTSVVDARGKSWRGSATFAMVPTLAREKNLNGMPPLDLLVIDEAHHAAANSYRRIIDTALDRNPQCRVYGVTATPGRGDRQALRPIFSNVADQVRLGELIQAGNLVKPRTFVIDVGAQEALKNVRKTVDDFDMAEVDRVMNKAPVTEAVVQHWKEKAGTRKTVVFCSTVDHARNVADAFNEADVEAVMVHGELSSADRKATMSRFEKGSAMVVVNVAVLTEGWDYQPTSCVVLLRPSSFKSTMIQMVGRGLRTVDPNEYPGVIKNDCVVLDFGISSLLHGSLEQDVNLDGKEVQGEAPTKECPECQAIVPLAVRECSLCGYIWESDASENAPESITDFIMSEVDLLARSSFLWVDLFGDDAAMVANGFNAWGGIFFLNGNWHAVGGAKGQPTMLLSIGERTICLAAANDWLNESETDESAHKTKSWLNQPPTEKQLCYLPPAMQMDMGMTRYHASALLTFRFNKSAIRNLIFEADRQALAEVA